MVSVCDIVCGDEKEWCCAYEKVYLVCIVAN